MAEEDRDNLTEKSANLRRELKTWEKDFAAKNDGRKAGREDIKQNPAIAQKYKEYNKIRDFLSGKTSSIAPPSPQKHAPRKRKQESPLPPTPSKRLQLTRTPSKSLSHPAIIDPYDSPSVIRNLFSPSKVIAPTPQKDGQILGLFDLLQDETPRDSPSKSARTSIPHGAGIQATPRKNRSTAEEIESTMKHSRTPTSSGKRYMLDNFATPLKRKHPNEQGGNTPSSVSKLHFGTPSFLRRDSQRTTMPVVDEDDEGPSLSPQMVRMPKKPLVRGLSSMLAGLRKMEEEAADEDLEALREMENEELSLPPLKYNKEDVQVEDSQARLPLGGFDDEAQYDTEPEPENDAESEQQKTYKKKGQKRSTRRIIMRPNTSKPAPLPAPVGESSDDELTEENLVKHRVAEPEEGGFGEARNFASDDDESEYTASEGGTRYKRSTKKEGKVKHAVRKVSALAHTNFKRLKLRNSGSKGGVAHNSRFRRKR